MGTGKDMGSWKFKRYLLVISMALIAVLAGTVLTDIYQQPKAQWILEVVRLFVEIAVLGIIIAIIAAVWTKLNVLSENGAKLEKIAEALEKNRAVLGQIDQTARISEAAKTIAFRDADIRSLREAVFDKLQQQDYDATYDIINKIAGSMIYQNLAEQLRKEADNYRSATDKEREKQVIAHIEKLFDNHLWAKASILIERLITAFPDSAAAKGMRQQLLDKKQERKKALLEVWDDAIKRQDTDRSLEILRELDLYLTPNEGLALQEAARDVFRSKLHGLGVQFSLAVSSKQWALALEAGEQIIKNFPNSRMAEEIRAKRDVLKQKVEQS